MAVLAWSCVYISIFDVLSLEAPKFANDSVHPYDATVQVGENLTFHCNAEAEPEAEVTWYMNGDKLNGRTLSLELL